MQCIVLYLGKGAFSRVYYSIVIQMIVLSDGEEPSPSGDDTLMYTGSTISEVSIYPVHT